MHGRLQPREAEALSGQARCERYGGGSPDRREVHFTVAKLSFVKNHHLGAFCCPLLPCSFFRLHSPSLLFLAVWSPSLGPQKARHSSLFAATRWPASRLGYPHLERHGERRCPRV